MKFNINKLFIWFKKEERPRILEFKKNKVNVITGDSSKGKSTILAIIDYCLLTGDPQIVTPIINQYAEWYGLEFNVGDKFFAIARRKPIADTSTANIYLSNSPFEEGFYPQNTNMHINDARVQLDLAFNITEEYRTPFIDNVIDPRISFRSFLMYNALTERIMTDSRLFTDYSFFESLYVNDINVRKYLFDVVLGLDNVERHKLEKRLYSLKDKAEKAKKCNNSYKTSVKQYHDLIKEIVPRLDQYKLLEGLKISEMNINDWIKLLECIITDYTPKKRYEKTEEEVELLLQYDKTFMTFRKMQQARKSYEEYIKSKNMLEDSLKPIKYLKDKSSQTGASLWTTYILDAFQKSLQKNNTERNSAIPEQIDESRFAELKKELDELSAKLQTLNKQEKVRASQRAEFYYLIGQLPSYLKDLNNISKKLNKCICENITDSELAEMDRIRQNVSNFNSRRYQQLSELNNILQNIFNGLNYMEHYQGCFIKYRIEEEKIALSFKDSQYDESHIGSQSNYMFLHLCFFLGIHRYMIMNQNKYIGQFLFIDQPSIPYYAGDGLKKTTDKEKLLDAFKAINDFMREIIENKKDDFQIILVEHANEEYWTGKNSLEYFITAEQFVEGNALIPNYIIESRS